MAEWKAVDTAEGTYFWNVITDEVVWERPQGVQIESYDPNQPVVVASTATSKASLSQLSSRGFNPTQSNGFQQNGFQQNSFQQNGFQQSSRQQIPNFEVPQSQSQLPPTFGADKELDPKPADTSGTRTVQLHTGNTVLDPKSVFNRNAGAHTSIGLPSGVVKNIIPLNYEDFANGYSWSSMKTDSTTKSGYLNYLAGVGWSKYWFVLKPGQLLWFKDKGASFAIGDIPLAGLYAQIDRVVKRPYVLHIAEGKKNHLIGCSSEVELSEWITQINISAQNARNNQGGGFNNTTLNSSAPLPPPIDSGALPEGWQECYTETGDIYYWNAITDESQWTRPASSPATRGPASTLGSSTPASSLGVMGANARRPDEVSLRYNKTEGAHASVSMPSGFTKLTEKQNTERKMNAEEKYAATNPLERMQKTKERKEMIEREIRDTDLQSNYLILQVVRAVTHKNERQFHITVKFNAQEWQIFRLDREFKKLYSNLASAKHPVPEISEYFPKGAPKLEDTNAALQYQGFLDHILRNRAVIIPEAKSKYYFLEFIAPSHLCDQTPPNFFLPFILQPVKN